MRVLGLLLVIYVGFAIVLYLPRPYFPKLWPGRRARGRFAIESSVRLLPALLLAYVIMILAWPWAALAPLNPIRGLLSFAEFQYGIRTVVDGQVYEMANTPRLYVPIYILIRVPLLTLFGAALAMMFALLPRLAAYLDSHGGARTVVQSRTLRTTGVAESLLGDQLTLEAHQLLREAHDLNHLSIRISYAEANSRRIEFAGVGERYVLLVERLRLRFA